MNKNREVLAEVAIHLNHLFAQARRFRARVAKMNLRRRGPKEEQLELPLIF